VLAAQGVPFDLAWSTWLAIFLLGALVTGAGLPLYYSLAASEGSVQATLPTYLVPIVALVLGAVCLGEAIALQEIAGAVLILAGVITTTGVRRLPVEGQRPALVK
jgi:drug/metabolite transporter (DMT)-like permease